MRVHRLSRRTPLHFGYAEGLGHPSKDPVWRAVGAEMRPMSPSSPVCACSLYWSVKLASLAGKNMGASGPFEERQLTKGGCARAKTQRAGGTYSNRTVSRGQYHCTVHG
jgi:hypothetical protein